MKIKSDSFLNYIKNKSNKIRVVCLYGPNLGLVDKLYNKALQHINVNENDPFSVSKIDGNYFSENSSILNDNLSTLSTFTEKRVILLNLMHISVKQDLETIIVNDIKEESDYYILIIKASSLNSRSKLIKYLENSPTCITTACYEESIINVKSKIAQLFNKYNLSFLLGIY